MGRIYFVDNRIEMHIGMYRICLFYKGKLYVEKWRYGYYHYCPKCDRVQSSATLRAVLSTTQCINCKHEYNPSEAIFNKERYFRVFSN